MKKTTIILLVLLPALSLAQNTPNTEEFSSQKTTQIKYLIQQISALKVYLGYLKEGYDIVQKGLTTVGNIKDATFGMDKTYLRSLKDVNPVVKGSPKIEAIIAMQKGIASGLQGLVRDCRNDENFSSAEVSYVETVKTSMLRECDDVIAALTFVLTADNAEMKDDERLARLDQLHEDMVDKHSFTQNFIGGTRLLSMQRAKEKSNADVTAQFYQAL